MSTEKYSDAIKYRHLAKNLREIKRSGRFGNFKEMATLLAISNQHLSDIINLRKEPSELLLNSMASVFGIPRQKLLAEEDSIVADHPPSFGIGDRKKLLVEKVKRLVMTADDGVINALLANVDEFQSGVDARRRLEEIEKK